MLNCGALVIGHAGETQPVSQSYYDVSKTPANIGLSPSSPASKRPPPPSCKRPPRASTAPQPRRSAASRVGRKPESVHQINTAKIGVSAAVPRHIPCALPRGTCAARRRQELRTPGNAPQTNIAAA